ncbi:MAG: hypothetical protein BJ554DRAFT_1856 [Olpidium bornovanus]|uniref:Uncharacterized protein n=1 Tax=Olpidium bornovanus TaxID=278681 RepID=A0A8H7ZRE8_9FUNG|nr:MAG: hypothetical protein BJ554DRAFT_1856 [Olpidium bornovanus]
MAILATSLDQVPRELDQSTRQERSNLNGRPLSEKERRSAMSGQTTGGCARTSRGCFWIDLGKMCICRERNHRVPPRCFKLG